MQSIQSYEQETDEKSLERFVLEHRLLVSKIALYLKKRLPSHIEFDDIMQSGLVGLLEARKTYDPTQGTSFESYAKLRIQGSIIDSLHKNSWLTRETSKHMKNMANAINTIEQRTHHQPSSEEIALELGLTVEEHFRISQEISISNVVSIDEFDHGDDLFGTDVQDPQLINQKENMKERLKELLAVLPQKEQLVLSLYYMDEFTFKQIGEILDLTEARVCQLHSQAITRIKAKMKQDI